MKRMYPKTVNTFSAILLLLGILLICLSACGVNAPPQEQDDPTGDSGERQDTSYLSITYGRDNSDNFTGREMLFYTYDLAEKQLTEEAIIPFDAKYASGVVSKADQKVYYSRRAEPENINANDSLYAYDMRTGETAVLETENSSYNEITMLDADTLLVMAVTREHPIMPARFDLKTRTFTYLPEKNNEPITLYTSNDSPINYNYRTKSFITIYQNEEEKISPAYHAFEMEINTYIALIDRDLTKTHVFPVSLLLGQFIDDAVQISENELLVERTDDIFNDATGELITERRFYSLLFNADGTATFTPTESPFPVEKVRKHGYRTVDGGKTWYLILGDKGDADGGLYTYDSETKELTPILLNDPAVEGYVINFSIVGP